jgi:hypothetical protein
MKKLLVITLIGLLSCTGLVSCGTDAGFEAVLVVLTADLDYGTVAPSSGPWGVVGGVVILVQKSATDITPVPNANVTLFMGGINTAVPTGMFLDAARTIPPGGATLMNAQADNNGALQIFPGTTVFDCTGTAGQVLASATITAVISDDVKSWKAKFVVDCP